MSGDNLTQNTQKKDHPFTSLQKINENLPLWEELEILWNGALHACDSQVMDQTGI